MIRGKYFRVLQTASLTIGACQRTRAKQSVESRNKLFLPFWQWLAYTMDGVVTPVYKLLEAADR